MRENKKKTDDSEASKESEVAEKAETPKETVEQKAPASEESIEEKSETTSEDTTSGGRFSHVPDNFDK